MWCCCQAKDISQALFTVPQSRKASPIRLTLVMVKHGAVCFQWPVCAMEISSNNFSMPSQSRYKSLFDRVIQLCAILADGLILTSVGSTFTVIESSNDTFSSSMLAIYVLLQYICFYLLLNLFLYIYKSKRSYQCPNIKLIYLIVGFAKIPKSFFSICLTASWTYWLPHLHDDLYIVETHF